MKPFLHRHDGYLALIIALVIITIAFTSLVTSYVFSNKALGVNSSLSSMQSYYLAQSGLERAKYDLTVNKIGCAAINGTANYTGATFPNAAGQFTTTGVSTKSADNLSGALTSSLTTIALTSSSGFATSGTISIDSEIINYTGISSNTLTGATRGVGGTNAQAHANGASVMQNQCVLTSTGAVPSTSSAITQRVIQETLLGSTFSLNSSSTGSGSSGGAGSGIIEGALVVGGSVSLGNGALIVNSNVTMQSGNYSGSTVVANGPAVINGTGETEVSDGNGSLVVSSSSSGIKADILQDSSLAASSSLFGHYFNASKATVQASSNQTYNSSNINNATGQTIWTSDLNLNSATTIGSLTSPVTLIVNGNLNISSTFTLYGLLYVTGSVAMNGTTIVNGGVVMEGAFNSNGPTTINFNPALLGVAGATNSNSNTIYSAIPANSQEIFA